MPDLPSANVSVDEQAAAFSGNTGYAIVISPVSLNADTTPRVFTGAKGLLTQHAYSPGASYVASHVQETRKPVIFVGVPIATQGEIGSEDETGVAGTSVITITAGASGPLDEVEGVITVVTGGTIGTNGITFRLSLDGGRSTKLIRLGTATSYAIPYLGLTINFAAGTLVAEDEFTFRTSAPMWDSAGLTAARVALAAQLKPARSMLVVGDVPNSTFAGFVVTEVNAYETANQRFTYARASLPSRLPLAKKSKVAGQTLTFANAGGTITRTAGSWLADGFKVGDSVSVAGSTDNDGTVTITDLTATVMTVSETLTDEAATASEDVTMLQVLTKAAHTSAMDAAFASVDGEFRIDLAYERARKQCPITGWLFRRPASWAASIREYRHDLHIAAWRKEDGSLSGWSLDDEDGNLVEHDERVDGGALQARFTCFRTYGNGPEGVFLAMSLTRAVDGSLLALTNNVAVANLGCTIVQAETENAIGQTLVLKTNGRATEASLSLLEGRVNTQLELNLLRNKEGEGQRASFARWQASRDDVLNVAEPVINGVLNLLLNGTLHKINTVTRVQSSG